LPKSKRVFRLAPAYVEMLHDVVVCQLWPTDKSIAPNEYRNKGLIDSATARPFQAGYGEEFYKTIAEKAAALFHSLSADHCFFNGNKRTAVLALDHFLLANGYYLALPNEEMRKLAKDTASYRESRIPHDEMFRQIVKILKSSMVSLQKLAKEPGMVQFYRRAMNIRRLIRNHELNRIPLPEPPESA